MKASALYLAAGKAIKVSGATRQILGRCEDADINSGSIRQSAIDLYPNAKNSTRNRQVIVPTLAVINHCAELGHCSPLRMKRFKVDTRSRSPSPWSGSMPLEQPLNGLILELLPLYVRNRSKGI
ncbi:hypothetical protein IVB34_47835 [Bradyrhizobium sp. 2]|uniref:hypothetical protein n=1 Tax=Bradyrhizobium sp. 2 TaxID=190045 RepID=UPI001FFA5DE7|nr:hypothetical protein [Bradyrhizobium sp. 2]MCK1465800.1 hypothetical protein [Bradyrhizobium sp. 2]